MTGTRVLSVAAVAAALLLVRAEHVIGQPVEDCLSGSEPTVPVPVEADVPALPPCPVVLDGAPAEPFVPAVLTPGLREVDAGVPPVPAGGGCVALDPGPRTCTFAATGWVELEVFAVVGYADVIAADGKPVGGFGGAGYDPPERFGAVLPAAPGQTVVVRVDRGWVVGRNRS